MTVAFGTKNMVYKSEFHGESNCSLVRKLHLKWIHFSHKSQKIDLWLVLRDFPPVMRGYLTIENQVIPQIYC